MSLVKRMTESLNNSTLKENIESVYKNCQIIENEDGLYSIIYKGIEVADNFKNKKSAKVAIDQEMKTWPNDPWGQGMLTESLNKSTLNEDVNEYTALYNEIVDWVYNYVTSFQAQEVAQDIEEYDSDWAESDGSTEISYKMDEAALKYAQICAEGLLADYNK